jgi:hypothetical protein
MASASDVFDLDGYHRLEDAGVTHVLTMPWAFHYGLTDNLEEKRSGIRRFADEVLTAFA